MANCFPFAKSKSVVCEDASVTWSNQVVIRSPINFSNGEDSLNETYSSAVDNETQYLSVLESPHDETLEDIHNLTLNNHENIELNVVGESENNFNLNLAELGDQVMLFNVEGTDEMFGVQIAADAEGQVHKYQFKCRKTDDGQIEVIPESVEVSAEDDQTLTEVQQGTIVELNENQIVETPVYLQQPLEKVDENIHLLITEETEQSVDTNVTVYRDESEEIETSIHQNIFRKSEQSFCKEGGEIDDENELYADDSEDTYIEESADIKPGVEIEVKQELLLEKNEAFVSDSQESEDTELDNHEETVLENLNEGYASEDESYTTTEIHDNVEETIVNYQNFDAAHIEEIYEDTEETSNNAEAATHYEQLFIEETSLEQLTYEDDLEGDVENIKTTNVVIVEKDSESNDLETEDYEIVEGMPVTAEGEISEDTSSTIYQETEVLYSEPEISVQNGQEKDNSIPKLTNILKQPTNIKKTYDTNKKTILYYMVPNTDQKENLNSVSLNNSNPRSLLKNKLDINKINEEQIKKLQREKLLEKRYARSKEAVQAKLFNNFINKTTIPHAPVRQGRLPRKQEIKPVDTRRDEEIIVQEVMVSSNGFVESISDRLKNLDKLEVTSIVELSDSDEDYDPKNGIKKKKKHKKTKPINSAASDSDTSIIEIFHSDDEPGDTTTNTVKKGRDRSKSSHSDDSLKRSHRGSKSGSSDESSPQKKSRTDESSEVDSDSGKKEINCPHCSKTFPSQSSLSTHIQHHSLENILRNITAKEYKHKCEDCQEIFKNSILLKRHVCNKDLNHNYKCGVCCKTFRDITLFNIHKKSHIKENLVKSTSTVTISPKKFTPRPSTSKFKAPSNMTLVYKCKECSKICSSQSILTIHEKSHKKYFCANCKMSFASKLLLDSHVRIKCVKTSSPKDKRLSFKIRRSFVNSPRRASLRGRSVNPLKASHPTPLKGTLTRKSSIPSTSFGKTKVNPPSDKILNSDSNKSLHPGPKINNTAGPKRTANSLTRKTLDPVFNRKVVAKGNSSMINTKSNVTLNPCLNSSSMVRTLDVETQCDSCPQKFTSLTTLFKHKVKNHGLHTPDKRVLEPKRKALHKPLNLHGGIPANERLNKAFQEMRKKLVLAETDPSSEGSILPEKCDTSEKSEIADKSKLPEIIVSETK